MVSDTPAHSSDPPLDPQTSAPGFTAGILNTGPPPEHWLSLPEGLPDSSDGVSTSRSRRRNPNTPRVRTTKACEPCRARRIKCVGTPPCQQCRQRGTTGACTVRRLARPSRHTPRKQHAERVTKRTGISTLEPGPLSQDSIGEGTGSSHHDDATSSYPSADLGDLLLLAAERPPSNSLKSVPCPGPEHTANLPSQGAFASDWLDLGGDAIPYSLASTFPPGIQTVMNASSQSLFDFEGPSPPLEVGPIRCAVPIAGSSTNPLSQLRTALSAWCTLKGELAF